MAQGVQYITPVDVKLASPTDSAWNTIDVTSSLPGGDQGSVAGVILHVFRKGSSITAFGLRKGGQTGQTRTDVIPRDYGFYFVGLNSSDEFEVFCDLFAGIDHIDLIAFIPAEAGHFFDIEVDVTPVSITTGSWANDIDLTAEAQGGDTIRLAFVHVRNGSSGAATVGVRVNGSSDELKGGIVSALGQIGAVVGLDNDEIFELFASNNLTEVFLIGYLEDAFVSVETNGINKSTSNVTTYADVDVTADITGSPEGVFIKIGTLDDSSNQRSMYTRRKGDTIDRYVVNDADLQRWSAGWVGIDGDDIFQQRIEHVSQDCYVMGHALDGGAPAAGFNRHFYDRHIARAG